MAGAAAQRPLPPYLSRHLAAVPAGQQQPMPPGQAPTRPDQPRPTSAFAAGYQNPHEVSLEALGDGLLRVSWQNTGQHFVYNGTQLVYLCVPAIGAFDFHPFS
jgi:hypothetical protein